MNTLLIYGDSFGEETMHNHPLREKALQFRTFHSDLRESGIFDKVTVYAEAASDLWSQYKLFKQTFTGNEHVLWFETDPLRFKGPDNSNYTNVSSTLNLLHTTTNSFIRLKNQAAINYWKYLQDESYVNFIHKAIMNDIHSQCKYLLILPCFNTSHSCVNDHLACITHKELKYWNLTYEELDRRNLVDIRRNHITETNHAILGSMLVNYYKTGAHLDFSKFENPVNESKEKYFI